MCGFVGSVGSVGGVGGWRWNSSPRVFSLLTSLDGLRTRDACKSDIIL